MSPSRVPYLLLEVAVLRLHRVLLGLGLGLVLVLVIVVVVVVVVAVLAFDFIFIVSIIFFSILVFLLAPFLYQRARGQVGKIARSVPCLSFVALFFPFSRRGAASSIKVTMPWIDARATAAGM